MFKKQHYIYSAVIITMTVGGFQYSAAVHPAAQDEQVYKNAIPDVTRHVENKAKEACDQVVNMEKQPVDQPRWHAQLDAWKKVCERRTMMLNKLKTGSDHEKLATIKQLSPDQDVKMIIESEKAKLQPSAPHKADDWHSPL